MITARGASFQATIMHEGRRFRRSFRTRKEAEVWEAQARLALVSGEEPDLGPQSRTPNDQPRTLEELQEFVARRFWTGSKGEKTAQINSDAVVRILGKDKPIRSITEEDVDRLVFDLERAGNSNGTINRKLAALSKMLTVAQARGWVPRKVRIDRKREAENRIRWLDADEEARLTRYLRHIGKHDYVDLFTFLVDTGLRVGEALRLEWRDVDLDRGLITVWISKGERPRSVPLTGRVKAILRARKGTGVGPWTWTTPTSLRHAWTLARAHMGLVNDEQFVPHALRHTFASRLVQAGVPILTVKELCGHKSIEITLRYAHLAPTNLVDAISRLEASAA